MIVQYAARRAHRALAAALAAWLAVGGPLATRAAADSCQACVGVDGGALGGAGDPSQTNKPISMAFVTQLCGPVPTSGGTPQSGQGSMWAGKSAPTASGASKSTNLANQGVDPGFRTSPNGDSAWDQCFKKLVNSDNGGSPAWIELQQYCAAEHLASVAGDTQQISATLYTIAAAACTAACAAQWAAWSGAYEVLEGACVLTGGAAGVADIVNSGKLQDLGRGMILGMDGGALLGVGSDAAAGVNAAIMTAGALRGGSSTGAGASAGSAFPVATCVVAGTMIATAALHWGAIGSTRDSSNSSCGQASSLMSQITPQGSKNLTPSTDAPSGSTSSSFTGNTGQQINSPGLGGSGGRSTPIASSQTLSDFASDPFNPKYALATAGPVYPLLKGMNTKALTQGLDQMGASVKGIADKLATQSPAAVLGSMMPDLPPGLLSTLKDVEKNAVAGRYAGLGTGASLSGTYAGGGAGAGAGKSAAKPNPFGMFAMKDAPGFGAGAGGATETVFEKVRRELAAAGASGDIWHEGFGGSIFQIVSGRLGLTRDRVEQLEWDTPLNRALMGLPALRPAALKPAGAPTRR